MCFSTSLPSCRNFEITAESAVSYVSCALQPSSQLFFVYMGQGRIELQAMRLTQILLKPKASEVLTAYLKQCNEPPWTSYFVKFKDVENDQRGMSHFNWTLDTSTNYHILRTGCYPYIKYHCSKRNKQDLSLEDKFFRFLKIINLGLPMLFYGLAAIHLISHTEIVKLPDSSQVPIYFLYAEDKGSRF